MSDKINKKEIIAKFSTFSVNAPISEEEFEDGLNSVAQFLLFGTKWETPLANSKVIDSLPVLKDLPMVCKADDCPYALRCPILRGMKDKDKKKLLGTDCRADRHYAVDIFTSLVKSLDVAPDYTIDVLAVADLVRLHVLKRRIDWDIAVNGMTEDNVSAVNERTGDVYMSRVANPLWKVSEGIAKQIAVIERQLMASRSDRIEMAEKLGTNKKDFLNVLLGKNKPIDDNIIEAEFVEE